MNSISTYESIFLRDFNLHYSMLRSYLAGCGIRDDSLADSITNDVLIRFWLKFKADPSNPLFSGDELFVRRWLRCAVKRKVIDHYRLQAIHIRHHKNIASQTAYAIDEGGFHTVDVRDEFEALRRFIATCDDTTRRDFETLWATILKGESVQNIAERMSVGRSTVWRRSRSIQRRFLSDKDAKASRRQLSQNSERN